MKQVLKKNLPVLLTLILIVIFGAVLLMYTHPMQDMTLDLSLIDKNGAAATETFDEKDWVVYVQEGDERTLLENNGRGFYLGIELGQTLYLSRVLEEDLEAPTLQIGTAERTFTVWLDDEVIYTDYPELDNRIGQLRLPMNEYNRLEPISISLPRNYQGKTLTIAQSTPEWSEGSTVQAAPASVVLYCGYAYESGIIAESYSLAITATALFVVGLVLLAAFLRRRDWSLLCIALTAFLAMCIILNDVSFRYRYFGSVYNYHWYLRWLTALTLLAFLALKAASHKKLMQILLCVCAACTPVSVLLYAQYHSSILLWPKLLFYTLPESLFLVTLATVLVLGMKRWRKENRFYRVYAPLALTGLAAYWSVLLAVKDGAALSLYAGLTSGSTYQLYRGCLIVAMVSALVAALWDALQTELESRMEKSLLEQRRDLTMASYENMSRQHREVMELRHDMMNHFKYLRELPVGEDAEAYLTELIGQNSRVRPVVHTGNSVLDIVLNGKLSAAIDTGIIVEIQRATAPENLPIPDAELSSLVMNMMDNAITAASSSGAEKPMIRLDIHGKDQWLAIVCENSADIRRIEKARKKETVPKHGLGLKIMEGVTQRCGGLFTTEYGTDYYKVSAILPLD